MFRRIIYIGQSGSDSIYLNTATAEVYKMASNSMLSTDKTKNSTKYVVALLTIGIPLLGLVIHILINGAKNGYAYTPLILLMICVLWIIECVGLTYIVDKALYGPIKHGRIENAKSGTKAEFRQAVMSNNQWNVYKNKKATVGKKLIAWIMTSVFPMLTIALIPIGAMINSQGNLLGHKIGSEIIMLSLLGIMPFASILLLWINNPIRWLNVVSKYQNRELWGK